LIIRSRNKAYKEANDHEPSLSDSEAKALDALLKTKQGKK